ncbi:hypothetical protein NDU88_001898 [Pleurodeles waltl]|uniref:Uncharacterized protein n=1 Tax=Pleurodeles waltl TaxID=8319 RepID=A0AAV7VD84_PLEWA|nr:hypothetical protein NDU88_001898 [Pleurodeles waltl]
MTKKAALAQHTGPPCADISVCARTWAAPEGGGCFRRKDLAPWVYLKCYDVPLRQAVTSVIYSTLRHHPRWALYMPTEEPGPRIQTKNLEPHPTRTG